MDDTIYVAIFNIDVVFDYTSKEKPCEPQENIEILAVYIDSNKIGEGSQRVFLNDVYVFYDPMLANESAKEYSIKEIIDFHIWDYIKECKLAGSY